MRGLVASLATGLVSLFRGKRLLVPSGLFSAPMVALKLKKSQALEDDSRIGMTAKEREP
jgi:hypothetical protein